MFITTRGAANVKLGQLNVGLVPKAKYDELHLLDRATAEAKDIGEALLEALRRGDETEKAVSDIKAQFAELLDDRAKLVQLLDSQKYSVRRTPKWCARLGAVTLT